MYFVSPEFYLCPRPFTPTCGHKDQSDGRHQTNTKVLLEEGTSLDIWALHSTGKSSLRVDFFQPFQTDFGTLEGIQYVPLVRVFILELRVQTCRLTEVNELQTKFSFSWSLRSTCQKFLTVTNVHILTQVPPAKIPFRRFPGREELPTVVRPGTPGACSRRLSGHRDLTRKERLIETLLGCMRKEGSYPPTTSMSPVLPKVTD